MVHERKEWYIGFIAIKRFVLQKLAENGKTSQDWDKVSVRYRCDKGILSNMYRYSVKKTAAQLKMGKI